MNFIEALYTMLARQGDALKEFAFHEANGKVFRLSLQLGRLRTAGEQKALLEKNYTATLQALEDLDTGPFAMIYQISNLLPQATITIEELGEQTQRFVNAFYEGDGLKAIGFSEFFATEMSEIPKDGIAHQALEVYKSYVINEHLLERITETLDHLEANKEQKLTSEQLQAGSIPEELKEMLGTIVQQAVQPLFEIEHTQFDKAYMNMHEAAAYLNIAKQTLYGLTSKRAVPFVKRGRGNLFVKADLDEYLTKGKKQTIDQMKENIVPKSRKGH